MSNTGAALPSATVVVSVHNEVAHITEQLDALRPQLVAREAELIVVDDASTDGTAEEIRKWLDSAGIARASLLRRTHRGGPNASRNDGLARATSDIVTFCDGDDVVAEDWLNQLVAQCEPGRLVGGRSIECGHGRAIIEWPAAPVAHGWGYCYGGNMAARRVDLIGIGGFDESIRAGGTEVDLAIRGQASGAVEIFAVATATVFYRRTHSPVGIFAREFRKERGRSYLSIVHRSLGIESRGLRSFLALIPASLRAASKSRRASPRSASLAKSLGRLTGWAFWLPLTWLGYRLHLQAFRPRLLAARHPDDEESR